MEQLLLSIEKITNPPEKVILMYQAIADLMKTRQDAGMLKVSEITQKAGIGKGTVYEYFASKEELLANALAYELREKLGVLIERLGKQGDFRSKIMCIFDWISENRDYHEMNWRMVRIYMGRYESCEAMRASIPDDIVEIAQENLRSQIHCLMRSGAEEGIYTETDDTKRQIAFMKAMVEYAMTVKGINCDKDRGLTDEELREFVYSSMVKALNL